MAVGRCENPACTVRGGAAFCPRHADQHRRRVWCSACGDAETSELDRKRSREAAEKMDIVWALIHEIESLAGSLDQAGVARECYSYAVEQRRKLLGGWRDVKVPPFHYGWYVGQHQWPYTTYDFESGCAHDSPSWHLADTYVTTDGAIVSGADRIEPPWGRDVSFYSSIVHALTRLARANGIAVA